MLPYADLLTLLVALFIVLFAMSKIDTKKYDQISQVFREEFTGGKGILEQNQSPVDKPLESNN
ncbi:flagellar motor protein MotB [Virgibacillus sp. L01]|uniref:flagellar motor protein MotB n=1 Tax=Virgibacillus sp. L01 TaxID=3457429 RepID=UPI003FD36C12